MKKDGVMVGSDAVSYTHLDVYKRQVHSRENQGYGGHTLFPNQHKTQPA